VHVSPKGILPFLYTHYFGVEGVYHGDKKEETISIVRGGVMVLSVAYQQQCQKKSKQHQLEHYL